MTLQELVHEKFPDRNLSEYADVFGMSRFKAEWFLYECTMPTVARLMMKWYPEHTDLCLDELAKSKEGLKRGGENHFLDNNKDTHHLPPIDSNDILRYTLPVLYPQAEVRGL